jgi:hypothetical protein
MHLAYLALPPHWAALGRAWLVLAWVRPARRVAAPCPPCCGLLVHSLAWLHRPAHTGQARPLRPLHEFILLNVHL